MLTVEGLIERLKSCPSTARVVVRGYEGGVSDVVGIKDVYIRLHVNPEGHYGEHAVCGEDWSGDPSYDEVALKIY